MTMFGGRETDFLSEPSAQVTSSLQLGISIFQMPIVNTIQIGDGLLTDILGSGSM
jgi:predicted HAD superfamily phosphohydrolase YqeG